MNLVLLETSQMLKNHPLIEEKNEYKLKYINVLEYFVRKYSAKDPWANQTLRLYVKKLLGDKSDYQYNDIDVKTYSKAVLATKFRPFKFFTYRFCLIIDCIFICAYQDKEKADRNSPKRLLSSMLC